MILIATLNISELFQLDVAVMDAESWDSEQGSSGEAGREEEAVDVEEFDFSNTLSVCRGNELQHQPEYKNYFLKRILKKTIGRDVIHTEESELQRIRFAKAECGSILEKVARVMVLDVNNIKLKYTIKSKQGALKEIVITNSESVHENLENLYSETKENSTIIVETKPAPPKKPVRKVKKSEIDFKALTKAKQASDVYRMLKDHPNQIQKYQVMLLNVRVMMGEAESINLITPGHFICPICQEKKTLKSFNNKSVIVLHLRGHFVQYGESKVQIMLNRLDHFDKHEWSELFPGATIQSLIETKMNEETFTDDSSLKLPDEPSMFIARRGGKFIGAFLALDEDRLARLIKSDPTALDGVLLENTDTRDVMAAMAGSSKATDSSAKAGSSKTVNDDGNDNDDHDEVVLLDLEAAVAEPVKETMNEDKQGEEENKDPNTDFRISDSEDIPIKKGKTTHQKQVKKEKHGGKNRIESSSDEDQNH